MPVDLAKPQPVIPVGKRLYAIRLKHNLSQGEFADRCGLGVCAIQKYETGYSAIPLKSIAAICLEFGMTPAEFLSGIDARDLL